MTDVATQHELVLVNRYNASPEQLWEAWTEPENFVQWWCPLEALKAGTEMFFTRLGEFLAR